MRVNLSNPTTHQVKQVKVGFSWTVFFFGFFPMLFRGDWKWFAITFFTQLVLGGFTAGIGSMIVSIVFSFIYNNLYINDLLTSGYIPADKASTDILLSKGITMNTDSSNVEK